MERFLRKIVVALLPRSVCLKSRLGDGSVVYGRNLPGHGGRGVYIYGDDIEPELAHLDVLVQEGSVALDVGANVGVYTVKLGRLVGESGCVVAVEPFPASAAMNLRNILENGLGNVRLRVCALSDRSGRQALYMRGGKPNSFTLARDDVSATFDTRLSCIDDLVEQEELSRVDLIKLDVEGAENEVLRGASKTIRRFRPTVMVEQTLTRVVSRLEGYSSLRIGDSDNIVIVPSDSDKLQKLLDRGFRPLAEASSRPEPSPSSVRNVDTVREP